MCPKDSEKIIYKLECFLIIIDLVEMHDEQIFISTFVNP
jgi:hypothetical protein